MSFADDCARFGDGRRVVRGGFRRLRPWFELRVGVRGRKVAKRTSRSKMRCRSPQNSQRESLRSGIGVQGCPATLAYANRSAAPILSTRLKADVWLSFPRTFPCRILR